LTHTHPKKKDLIENNILLHQLIITFRRLNKLEKSFDRFMAIFYTFFNELRSWQEEMEKRIKKVEELNQR